MGRFTFDEADNYGNSSNGGSYFQLKNDKDVACVRFLYNSADDVEGYAIHEVEIDGNRRYVNCLRAYNEPLDNCPFCRANMKVMAKLFVPLYNEDTGTVQVWERGKTFFQQITSICSRYGRNPIVSQTFEIERNGKPKDTKTIYNIYRTDEPADDKTLDDFEMPRILGTKILDKSFDDMEYFLSEGEFPPEDSVPRRSSRQENEMPMRRGTSGRRTPASRRNEDTF